MKWTGLTGGIATGKSTAAQLIKGLGFPVIDADEVSHRLSAVGQQGYLEIVSQFGKDILFPDLSIDRKKLGQLIFSDVSLKARLEGILHPLIKQEVQNLRHQYQKQGVKLCFYDVPLLFEKNLTAQFDTTLLIWCDPKTQLERLIKRSDLSLEDSLLRIKNQLPLVEKVRLAEHCIDNTGDLSDLEKQLKKLISQI